MSMIKTDVKNIPDFAKGSLWEFPGYIKTEAGVAVDIHAWTIEVFVFENGVELFNVTADCATNGAAGRYDVNGAAEHTSLATAGQTYDVEIVRTTESGWMPIYKGKVKCLEFYYTGA